MDHRVGPAAGALSASLLAAAACHIACQPGSSSDPPAAQGTLVVPAPQQSPIPAPVSVPSPSIPLTCWGRAKTSEERNACAEDEFQTADRDLNEVYGQVLADADPDLRRAVRSAERAWLSYRDSYLLSLAPLLTGSEAQAPVDHCRPIVLARVTRGRVGELTRMLARANHDSPIVGASCEGAPVECEQAYERLEGTYRRLAETGPRAGRRRLKASQEAWQRYLAAQTAVVLAWHRPSEPSLRTRLRESVRARLSLDRIAHLATFEHYRQPVDDRCRRIQTEARTLAELEAQCNLGEAGSCNSLGQALRFGWYSIDRDRPRARALFRKACQLGNGTACESLAHAFGSGQGVARDLAEAARILRRGCDAGDAANCQSLALAHAQGRGVPKDVAQAIVLWQHACDLSHSDDRTYWGAGHPCRNLARAFESGELLPRDPARALAMHEAACEVEQSDGCVAAARLLRERSRFDVNRVISLYARGCSEHGDAAACVELGDFVRATRSGEAALRWYRSACAGGFVPGCRAVSELTGTPMGDPDEPVPDPDYIRTVRFVVAEQVQPLRLRLFGSPYGRVMRLQVFDEAEHQTTQEIAVPDSPDSDSGATLPLGQVDLNFDGYRDLTLRHYTGANNAGDFIWIFDPGRRRFTYCSELSDLPNLKPDPEHRVLTSQYHFSASEGSTSQYKWIRDKAVLVRQDSTRYVREEGGGCFEQVTRELVRGRLVETEKSCN